MGLIFEGIGFALGFEAIFIIVSCGITAVCFAFDLKAFFKPTIAMLWLWMSVMPLYVLARDWTAISHNEAVVAISRSVCWFALQGACIIFLLETGAWKWPLAAEK